MDRELTCTWSSSITELANRYLFFFLFSYEFGSTFPKLYVVFVNTHTLNLFLNPYPMIWCTWGIFSTRCNIMDLGLNCKFETTLICYVCLVTCILHISMVCLLAPSTCFLHHNVCKGIAFLWSPMFSSLQWYYCLYPYCFHSFLQYLQIGYTLKLTFIIWNKYRVQKIAMIWTI